MTLKIHISNHNDDLHNTTAKRNIAGGVCGLTTDIKVDHDHIDIPWLTVANFESNPATGTAAFTPEDINDGLITSYVGWDNIGEYAEITLDHACFIKEFRTCGHFAMNSDGVQKIEYLDINGNWTDAKINIYTHHHSFSAWTNLDFVIFASKIRFTATSIDSLGRNIFAELEMRG